MDIGAKFTIGAGVTGQDQLDKLNEAAKKIGQTGQTSAGQFNAAMRGLPAQMTDVVTSLQGGQSPLTVLLQQGGQIKDQFGGIGAAARGLGQYIAGLANPVTLLAVAVAGLGIAAFKGASEQQALRDQMVLNGNAAGMTMGRFDELAKSVQASTGVTIGAARDLAAAAAATGTFTSGSIQAATSAMGRIQQLSGASADQIAKDFGTMQNGVAKWAAEHNRQYNYLTAAQFAYIRQLEQQGKTEEAIRLNSELLDKALAGRTRQLGLLERGWEGVKGAASRAWDAMLNIGREDTLDQKLAKAQAKLADLERSLAGGGTRGGKRTSTFKAEIEQQKQLIESLKEQAAAEAAAADAASKRAKAEQEKIDKINSGGADRESAARLAVDLQQAQNASAARIALQEQQKARLDGLKRAELIDDESYAKRKVEIEREILAEQAKLVDIEIAIEKRKPANNAEQKLARDQRILALQQKAADIASKGVIVGFDAQFLKPADQKQISDFESALSGLGAQAEKLQFQGQYITQFGERAASAAEVMARFETMQGKFKDLTAEQKTAYIEAARAVDELTASLQRQQAGLSYQKQTAEIQRQTAELGQNALQRKINADLQALENAGIKQGTELYTQLAEQRINALQQADAASRQWAAGVQEGLNAYLDTITNQAATVRDALTNAFRAGEDALVSFVTTGKLNFKSLVNSIIADLARMAIRNALSSAFGSGASGASILSSVVGAFTGTRAAGGRVSPYATYRVNEQGIETLQMGSQGGYILNAGQTQQAAKQGVDGGKSVVVNFTQSNNIGSNVSRSEISQALAQAKEQGKAELLDMLQRRGVV
jgi:lambda family phage tail tape measure protein